MGLERIKSGGKRAPGKLNSPTAFSPAEKAARAQEASARAGVFGANAIGKAAPSGEAWTRAAAGQTKIPGAAERTARVQEAGVRAGVSGSNAAAPSVTGGTGEAWTRAAPSQTRVPAPKAVSDDGIWARGSRYSGIGSNPVAVPSRPASFAAAGRGRVSPEPERGYSPGRERASRQYVSVPDTAKREAPSVDYRRMAELNRMESELERAWRQNAASRSPEEPLDYSRMPSNMLAQRRNQAQIDLDTDAMIQIDQVLKARRAARGQQTLGDRVGDTAGIAFANTVGSISNVVGDVFKTLNNPEAYRRQIEEAYGILEAGGYHYGGQFYPLSEEARKTIQNRIRRLADEAWKLEQPDSLANRAYRIADQGGKDAARFEQQAKEGLGEWGQLAVDVGAGLTQMGLDAAVAGLTGPGGAKLLMGSRSYGGASRAARLAGADFDQQRLAGIGAAAITLGTNQLTNLSRPFQKIYGKGLAETIAGRLAGRFGASTAMQMLTRLSNTADGRIFLSALGEMGEENLEGYFQAAWERFVYNPEAEYTAEEARQDRRVAGILGGIGSGFDVAADRFGTASGQNRVETGGTGTDAFLEGFLDGDTEPVQVGRGAAAKGPYPGEALALPQGGVVTGLADSGGGRLALEGRGGLQGAGGLPGVADFGELYAAALQNGFIQPGTMRDWRAEVEVPALYWEFLQNLHGVQGAQPAVPLLPEWSGGGWEGSAEIEGVALVPMFQDAVETGLEAENRREFAEFQAVLGDDAPKSLAEFLDLKYNRSEEWDYTKRLAEYIRKYPNSDRRYFDIQEQLRAVKGKGGVVLPPVPKQAFILPVGTYDPYHIMNRMTDRGITDDEIRSYMRDAKIMMVQWGGRRQLFIGEKGMCLIVKDGDDWKFRTAWKAYDYDESSDHIMEAIKNAGL